MGAESELVSVSIRVVESAVPGVAVVVAVVVVEVVAMMFGDDHLQVARPLPLQHPLYASDRPWSLNSFPEL